MMKNAAKLPASGAGSSAYAQAGVDIDSKMAGLDAIKKMVATTATKGVVGGIGNFGGLFQAPGKENLLVASTDGVGTKLKVAVLSHRHDTVGQDIVNHCVNDILVMGAKPLFFLDYIGSARFDTDVFKSVLSGLVKACRENGCALLGGETAEMPGLYPQGEYDLVGTIIGQVERKKVITGKSVRAGDVVIGLPSTGLQTNGYSLARKVIFDQCGLTPQDLIPGTRKTVTETLLAVHKSYLKPVNALMAKKIPISAMAHITGGGFVDNIPRVLPQNCTVEIDRASWVPPTIFTFIERQGKIDHDEMYRVFNMGIGYVIIVRAKDAPAAISTLARAHQPALVVGRVIKGSRKVIYKN
jgi:phosphoribosylformylglycinamidine cyclo-ligase